MERSPKRAEDKKANDIFEHIFRNALGNIIILTAIPTKTQMKANTIGYFDNEIFIGLANGELKRFTVTDIP